MCQSKLKVDNSSPKILVRIYLLTTFLCCFMIFWILVFPASTFLEHSAWRQRLFDYYKDPHGIAPPEIVEKHRGQYLVQATHILPSAIWSACIPIQFHSGMRRRYKGWHRYTGYLFSSISVAVSMGALVILYKGLLFEHSYPDLPPPAIPAEPGLVLVTIFFVGTLCKSLYHMIVRRDIRRHQKWMIRHVAAGLWVAIQRVLLVLIGSLNLLLRQEFTRTTQRSSFGLTGQIGMVISFFIGEVAIRELSKNQQHR